MYLNREVLTFLSIDRLSSGPLLMVRGCQWLYSGLNRHPFWKRNDWVLLRRSTVFFLLFFLYT